MSSQYFHSVILQENRCIGCTSCLKICPTEAIRVRDGKAKIIDERCIDCGECIRICPNHAKSAVVDNLDIIKKFNYTIAIPSLVLYGQFPPKVSINQILSSIKALGFDEVWEATLGAQVITEILSKHIMKKPYIKKPIINSSCPAILRLIQIRFPELLPNVADIETPIEITARIAKSEVMKKTGLKFEDIGVIFISPCTARVTSIRNPLGIQQSYIDGAVSIKDIYADMLRNINNNLSEIITKSTRDTLLWPTAGGQAASLKIDNYITVDGIHDVIKVLEEIELGKLEGLEFFEGMACIGGCVGGPLAIENSFIARNRIRTMAKTLPESRVDQSELKELINLYEEGFIRLTEPIEPKAVMSLDKDVVKSMRKMEMMTEIIKNLPGLDCGVCGAPSCRAFAEDIVKGENPKAICIVKTMESFKNKIYPA